jgi:8-oxo-dGTP pyrophosphatase MutT (NUDIX family)
MDTRIIIASGPVIVEDNKVLLVQHGDTDFWKFCGGKVEDYSTSLVDNARREVKEEMGIDINILNETPCFWYTKKIKDGAEMDVILVHYVAERVDEVVAGEDIRKWAWVSLETIEKEHLAPNILPVLKHFGYIK